MTTRSALAFAPLALCAAALAQGTPDFLLTFSQNESTVSGSGGTVLQTLRRNEIAHLQYSTAPCPPGASAEKWMPRTAADVMAGDENADGAYFNPTLFGSIDALVSVSFAGTPGGQATQRSVFWSVSAPMGNNVSLQPFRPGDVARIVRGGPGDGQVQYFMRQEQFNQALGLPLTTAIDVDAIAFQPNFGVYFSLDTDIVCNTACGPVLVRDGDVVCVPGGALTYTSDLRIAGVAPMSAVVVYTEAQMNAFIANAQVTDRFGACIANVIDTEALEMDVFGPVTTIVPCPGMILTVPTLIFSAESGTGASLLTTQGGGQIYNTLCGPAGTSCGFGPTMGPQLGIRPAGLVGAPSFVNGLCFARTCRHVLEPQQHVLNVFPGGAPAGFSAIDYGSPFAFNIILMEIVAPVVPPSLPAFPFSPNCFPDLYAPSVFVYWWPAFGPWGSFPTPAIPPFYAGKVLFQSIGFGTTFELSTPAVIDVQ
ncbi:MAG: hypothetical protein ABIP94_24010 [Planctomycetota bacterium]